MQQLRILAPLYKLLKNSESWQWNNEQQVAFEKIKEMLTAPNLLVHFDESKPLMLSCDVFPYGVGAVLSHVYADQLDKPIAYASRSLNTVERKYSQLDKEALEILFGVRYVLLKGNVALAARCTLALDSSLQACN